MIPNQWYAVLESDEVPRGKAVGVLRMGEKLCRLTIPSSPTGGDAKS